MLGVEADPRVSAAKGHVLQRPTLLLHGTESFLGLVVGRELVYQVSRAFLSPRYFEYDVRLSIQSLQLHLL